MIKSKIYKGIEYIQLNDLNPEHQESVLKSMNKSAFIKILINGQIVSNCLLYKDYQNWHKTVFRATTTAENVQDQHPVIEEVPLKHA